MYRLKHDSIAEILFVALIISWMRINVYLYFLFFLKNLKIRKNQA